ncbi:F-box protein SKIP8 [Carica papaya]|uniref:F-box protein SKIP8 n=1 Tax=Carica papaya TaxID=3649 RepID=UPI000B8C86CB|nr:F-box protein SKIP8 [Carica papaya]
MEIVASDLISLSSPHQPFFVATIITVLSLLLALLTVRSLPRKRTSKPEGSDSATSSLAVRQPTSSSLLHHSPNSNVRGVLDFEAEGPGYLNGVVDAAEMVVARSAAAEAEKSGASMMEQLVPEITTHALSYLDYPSLCRLSMTNSLMRKAANDDNAWKALYHKDFTLEQDSVTPVNGWKAYYAATRAILNVNSEFFSIIREKSLPAMGRFWLNADYVKCVHASGELFSGYNAVMQSWQLAFSWEHVLDFQVRDVRARVLTDMAWVTMKTYLDVGGAFHVTNVFEFHNGRWYMVHHHNSVIDGVEQPVAHG